MASPVNHLLVHQLGRNNDPDLVRVLTVDIFLIAGRHTPQLQRRQTAHFRPTAKDTAVVEQDLVAAQRCLQLGARHRRVAADQPPATDAVAVNEGGTCPEHGAGVAEGIGGVKVETGMDDDKIFQQDVEWQRTQKCAVEVRDVAGTVGLEALQRGQSAVGGPQFQKLMVIARLQAHLLVVATNAADRQAALAQLENEIQHPLAVRTPVDQVTQQVDAVTRGGEKQGIDQLPQGGGTAVDVADDKGARRHGHSTNHLQHEAFQIL